MFLFLFPALLEHQTGKLYPYVIPLFANQDFLVREKWEMLLFPCHAMCGFCTIALNSSTLEFLAFGSEDPSTTFTPCQPHAGCGRYADKEVLGSAYIELYLYIRKAKW